MISGFKKQRVLLLNEKDRKAGHGVVGGKEREWGDAKQLVCLPIGETRFIQKYTVDPSSEDIIHRKLDLASWGCLIELSFSGTNTVNDVEIIDDFFAEQIKL